MPKQIKETDQRIMEVDPHTKEVEYSVDKRIASLPEDESVIAAMVMLMRGVRERMGGSSKQLPLVNGQN